MTARLTLIAHAATESQRQAAFPLDEPVIERDDKGIGGFPWTVPRADRILSAPEQRAQQTSHILGLPVVLAEELRDYDYGRWSGRKLDVLQAEDPDGVLAWLTDPSAAPHGGESLENLIARVGRWMDEQRSIKHTIAVTHPAVTRAAIVHALQMPMMIFWRVDIAPLTLTDLRFSRGVWTLRCVGCSLKQHSDE